MLTLALFPVRTAIAFSQGSNDTDWGWRSLAILGGFVFLTVMLMVGVAAIFIPGTISWMRLGLVALSSWLMLAFHRGTWSRGWFSNRQGTP